jgi:hypothetical protein
VAESFGVDAERYDALDRSIPNSPVERIVAASRGFCVLDAVQCGAGAEFTCDQPGWTGNRRADQYLTAVG